MNSMFTPHARATHIGSLPYKEHRQALQYILEYAPEIPFWPQLPMLPQEGMLVQFLSGLPGVQQRGDSVYIDTSQAEFDSELLSFFEDYLELQEDGSRLEDSRFGMTYAEAPGFFDLLAAVKSSPASRAAIKGQLTGPITFCTGLVDQDGRAIFYNEELRDAAVKLLAMKACYQTRKLGESGLQPLVFFDEPGLAGFGSSAFITITPDDIGACFTEVFEAVQQAGGLAGVHVCANTEWPIIMNAGVDILSFDAYGYFDKLMLYPDEVVAFFARGGILASGIVPTTAEHIDKETVESTVSRWLEQVEQLVGIGVARDRVYAQTLITPSCGTGTINEELAMKVFQLTKGVADRLRSSQSA